MQIRFGLSGTVVFQRTDYIDNDKSQRRITALQNALENHAWPLPDDVEINFHVHDSEGMGDRGGERALIIGHATDIPKENRKGGNAQFMKFLYPHWYFGEKAETYVKRVVTEAFKMREQFDRASDSLTLTIR